MITDEDDYSSEREVVEIEVQTKDVHWQEYGDNVIKVEPGFEPARPANLVEVRRRLIIFGSRNLLNSFNTAVKDEA